jgi:hypothetical protein
MARLVRKQIYITPEQDELLKVAAARQRRTEAEIIRAALDQRLGAKRGPGAVRRRDALWGIVGLGTSTTGDVSENVDHYLYRAPKK